MVRSIDATAEMRAVRRAELLFARVQEDAGPALGPLEVIEPLLTRIDRAVGNGQLPRRADINRLAKAAESLDMITLQARGVSDALRHDLASELCEIADRLRPAAAPRRQRTG